MRYAFLDSNKAVKTLILQGFSQQRPVCSRPSTPKTKLHFSLIYSGLSCAMGYWESVFPWRFLLSLVMGIYRCVGTEWV